MTSMTTTVLHLKKWILWPTEVHDLFRENSPSNCVAFIYKICILHYFPIYSTDIVLSCCCYCRIFRFNCAQVKPLPTYLYIYHKETSWRFLVNKWLENIFIVTIALHKLKRWVGEQRGFGGGSRGLWFRYRYRNVYEQWWLTLISTTNGIYIAFRFHCDIVCLWGGRRWGWRRHSLFCRKQTEYCYYYVLNSHHKSSHLQSRTKRAFI